MSEQPKKTPDEVIADTPITKKMLDAVLDNRDVHLLNAIHEQQVKEFDSLKSALDQRFMSYDDSIKQLIDNDANIAGYFESLKKQGGAPEGGGGKIDIKDIGSTIRELVDAARAAGIIKGDDLNPIDQRYQIGLQQNLNKLYNRSLQVAWRASENVLSKEITGLTKSVTNELAKEIVRESHEPVL